MYFANYFHIVGFSVRQAKSHSILLTTQSKIQIHDWVQVQPTASTFLFPQGCRNQHTKSISIRIRTTYQCCYIAEQGGGELENESWLLGTVEVHLYIRKTTCSIRPLLNSPLSGRNRHVRLYIFCIQRLRMSWQCFHLLINLKLIVKLPCHIVNNLN